MTSSVIRRLERLETGGRSRLPVDLPQRLEAARKRWHGLSPEEYQREKERERHDDEQWLSEMRAAHAIKPLRGLALRLLYAMERKRQHQRQDRPQAEAGAR